MKCSQCDKPVNPADATRRRGELWCPSCLNPPIPITMADYEAAISGSSNLARSQVYATPRISEAATALRKKLPSGKRFGDL